MSAVADDPPRVHRFTRQRYEQMVDAGIFGEDDRLELLDGEIIEMAPQKSAHATALTLTMQALQRVFGEHHVMRVQLPLALDEHSEPEPDIAIVPGAARDYRKAHPISAVLVVEIADTTLSYDRGRKLTAYARNGIAEYWIVDIAAGTVEVCRSPQGERYLERTTLTTGAQIAPLAAPQSSIAVADLLP